MNPATASGRIQFDPAAHTYRVDGRPVPSVTQIIKRLGMISDRYTAEAALRGSYVAEATEYDDAGELDYDALDPQLRPYVDAWRAFRSESKAKIVAVECLVARMLPPQWYAGRLDRILKIETSDKAKGDAWLIDIKTGEQQRWHELQVSAYAMCFSERMRRGLVYLRNDGTYKLREVTDTDANLAWSACLALYAFLEKTNGT